MQAQSAQRSIIFRTAWGVWIAALVSALIWARVRQPDQAPPSRAAFEDRHRVCYDVYAASDFNHAYDLLALTFSGKELDKQYSVYAKSFRQLAGAGANVTVWDLQYTHFQLLESKGDRCTVRSKWTVVYVLGHSQHSHVRSNAYEVIFGMRKEADGWRIDSSRIVSENTLA